MLTRLFRDHPAKVGETYFEHMAFALGFSVRLFRAAFAALLHEQVEFRRDDPITVGFHLPTYPRQLVINGYITNALKLRGNFIRRIGIRAAPEGEAAAALAEYINTRQAEIIQQLQGLSRDLANL